MEWFNDIELVERFGLGWLDSDLPYYDPREEFLDEETAEKMCSAANNWFASRDLQVHVHACEEGDEDDEFYWLVSGPVIIHPVYYH